ncbi:hypothetical protein GH733_004980 [Mirounga leonina]|nr:hypothetical protein GH733_004980 [Mirounga leonina]
MRKEGKKRWKRKEDKKRVVVSNLPFEGPSYKENPNRHYCGNQIKTSKYTMLSFIPKNIFEQLHRFANLYFLGIVVLNFVPVVNAFQPEVSMIPICIILAVTAIKDAWEDLRRYKSDKVINNQECIVYSRKKRSYMQKCWKDVRVGDFIQMKCNEIIPADILLLFSSDPSGICHLETANLDGETNLKQRRVVKGFSEQLPLGLTHFSVLMQSLPILPSSSLSLNLLQYYFDKSISYRKDVQFEPEHFCNTIVCEKPNNHLNKFKGYMEHPDQTRTGFGSESLLLRGCTIRNTEVAVGIVIYAGHCLWNGTFEEHPPFDVPDAKGSFLPLALGGFYMFLTMIILLQVLIPVSLYVSIELVKLGQVFFLHNDLDLYDEETNLSIQCRALNITEDLGQIQYVFSDKTGTLTENKMVFRRCTIMGSEYSHQENGKITEHAYYCIFLFFNLILSPLNVMLFLQLFT